MIVDFVESVTDAHTLLVYARKGFLPTILAALFVWRNRLLIVLLAHHPPSNKLLLYSE